jgi:heterotetrameric sarcosine oxidase gamma subunit
MHSAAAPSRAPIEIYERPVVRLLQISAWPDTATALTELLDRSCGIRLPYRANAVSDSAELQAFWIGPHRWYLMTRLHDRSAPGPMPFGLRAVEPLASIVDITSARRVFAVSGIHSTDVMLKLTPLSEFGIGVAPFCAQLSIMKMATLIHVIDHQHFEIFVGRSYAEHLHTVLNDAAAEYEAGAHEGYLMGALRGN